MSIESRVCDPERARFAVEFLLPQLAPDSLVALARLAVSLSHAGVLDELRNQWESHHSGESHEELGNGDPGEEDQEKEENDDDDDNIGVDENDGDHESCDNVSDEEEVDRTETPMRRSARVAQQKKRDQRQENVVYLGQKKRSKVDAARPVQTCHNDNSLVLSVSSVTCVSSVTQALENARESLEWQMIAGPWIEKTLEGFSETELQERLTHLPPPLFSDSLMAGAAFCERINRLETFNCRFLRSVSGMNKSTKDEIIQALAMRYTTKEYRDLGQSVIPAQETRNQLMVDPETVLTRLQCATKESSDWTRIVSCARDAHIAWIWKDIGKTNAQVTEKLNDWFGTKHTEGTWANRRRMGQLLLQCPALAYQSVLSLDSNVSPFQIADVIKSNDTLKQLNDKLTLDFQIILGQKLDDNIEQSEELHSDGYMVIKNAIDLSLDTVEYFQRIKSDEFHSIFNNDRAENSGNDLLRLQVDYNNLQGQIPGTLRDQLVSLLQKECPGHSIRGMAVLRSEPGCRPQIPHTDYAEALDESPWYNWKTDQVPLGCVVALQDGTVFDVWPGSIRFNFEGHTFCHQQLVLNRGDVVVFRGDLVHAGAGFDHCNVRVHCYLEPNDGGFPRPKESDGTEITELMSNQPSILPRGSVIVRETWV